MQKSASPYYQKWRLIKDDLVRYGVITGGMGVIVAVVTIFFYLLYVVFPLFKPVSAEQKGIYALPEKSAGATLFLDMEEQNAIAARFTDAGKIVFFDAKTGEIVSTKSVTLPEGVRISSFAQTVSGNGSAIVYGLADGRAVLVKVEYDVTYDHEQRVITPNVTYPAGEEPLVLDDGRSSLEEIAAQISDSSTTVIAKTASSLHLASFQKEQNLFADESQMTRTDSILDLPSVGLKNMLLDKDGNSLYLVSANGRVAYYDVTDKTTPTMKQALNVVDVGGQITSATFLNGDLSLMVGDSSGSVSQWSLIRDAAGLSSLQKIRAFKVSDKPVVAIKSEQRRKGFVTVDSVGNLGVFHTTAEQKLLQEHVADSVVSLALSPRANGLLLQTADGNLRFWQLDNPHPEVSFKALWGKVWYESYQKPDYIWQSSASNSDFEPKYSLMPLVFGTLKAAFYAMLVGMPLALMGAIYTAYFMNPALRQYVKPMIELMGALPTVILGFLAGLWLAPFIEEHLAGFFAMMVVVPFWVMVFAFVWQFVPKNLLTKIPEGCDAIILVPAILIGGYVAFAASTPLEVALFQGSLRDWLKNSLGVGYDQRNSLIVGIAMGFAVIPSIFSIAEDAIFSVPKHLTVGSLALGATPWQTLSKVVLLTASPGIFSAIMIGFGRAVGETMIVLMSTGNTPVMDISIFQGMRTLAANIAVEMPESEVDSTHYRVLFLAALVLFGFTFIFNTLAEIVRQRLREKYSSL